MESNATSPASETVYTRAPYWKDVPDEKWMDWRWQMANRLNSLDEMEQVINLTESEKEALGTSGLFRVDITPYFASLIDPDDPVAPHVVSEPLVGRVVGGTLAANAHRHAHRVRRVGLVVVVDDDGLARWGGEHQMAASN